MVSDSFLADVLAVLIARYGMSPVQSAVLLFCMGRQVEGRLKITHIKVARHLGVEHANVTRALSSLENWHMLQRRANSLIMVNPLICSKGNADLQQTLEQLRQDARAALRKRLPEMRENVVALEKAASENFPEFTAAPATRTRQPAFEDNYVEEQAC
ncbi:helix-turn-helix domain-containing protein [Streptomyces sp. STCH 565 A]|uniref:MarR family transcriptional regulator n=1 Tax=Streptomyces sp. STCH 565 A TaxID=2950532 RepID=UPI00207510C5|nr:helix-turn-helix domain-containing protein [Streptomyces sp. STCH 565 A]MCM8549230.1 MarR family transcriptional regulator [Streptomyces sp. STCH 565 A]